MLAMKKREAEVQTRLYHIFDAYILIRDVTFAGHVMTSSKKIPLIKDLNAML